MSWKRVTISPHNYVNTSSTWSSWLKLGNSEKSWWWVLSHPYYSNCLCSIIKVQEWAHWFIQAGQGGQYENKNKTNNHSKQEEAVVCQIYDEKNHSTLNCWHKFNQAFQSWTLATMKMKDNQNLCWFPNTSDVVHVTTSIYNLHSIPKYHGCEKMIAGNGVKLAIIHIEKAILSNRMENNTLANIPVVPKIKKSLINKSTEV